VSIASKDTHYIYNREYIEYITFSTISFYYINYVLS